MAVNFTLTSRTRLDTFKDEASINDKTKYEIDCSAWQDENETLVSATWTTEYGQASITSQAIASGVVSAILEFTQSGRSLISILLTTSTRKKKIWLEIGVKDRDRYYDDDYGMNT